MKSAPPFTGPVTRTPCVTRAEVATLQPGDKVTVALEGPGPGMRYLSFLTEVEGTVSGTVDEFNVPVLFVIDEDNQDEWRTLMPDASEEDLEVGTHLDCSPIYPEWITRIHKPKTVAVTRLPRVWVNYNLDNTTADIIVEDKHTGQEVVIGRKVPKGIAYHIGANIDSAFRLVLDYQERG